MTSSPSTAVGDLAWVPGWMISDMVSRGELSATEVTTAFLERIEQIDGDLHSFITVSGDAAVALARALDETFAPGTRPGPLHGVPYSAKDNVLTKSVRTTFGSRLFESFLPDRDADVIARATRAGGVLVGKANLPEFSSWVRSRNLVSEECRNPWDLTRTSGASSGGSASAVAAGLVPISIGSDDGGSIRLPSALNGAFGLFPSPGRVPMGNAVVSGTVSQFGPISRDVRDAANFLDAIDGGTQFADDLERGIEGMRIAWISDHVDAEITDPRVVEVARAAAHRFVEAGATLEEPAVALVDAMGAMPALSRATSFQHAGVRPYDLPEWSRVTASPEWRTLLSPYMDPDRVNGTSPFLPEVAARQPAVLHAVVGQMMDLFADYDFLATPTIDQVAPVAPASWDNLYGPPGLTPQERVRSYVKYTLRVNFVGSPAGSIPCGFVDGMPVGLQLIGRPRADGDVLRAARAFEQLQPWAGHRPTAIAA